MKIKDGAKVFLKNEKLDKYLFVLRDNKPTILNPNMYGLLGGGVEDGENPIEALRRELQEESNICVSDIEELGNMMVTHATIVDGKEARSKQNKLFVFLAHINQTLDELKLYEGQKLEYFTIEEALNKNTLAPAVRDAINEFKEKLI